jgi:proteasome lid subunit RPN8/RPN11
MNLAVLSRAVLPSHQHKALAEACLRNWPKETCGVLFGFIQADAVYVDSFEVIRNVSPQPEKAFAFDPAEWVRIFFAAINQGKNMIGIFHSHPDGRLEPSSEDTRRRLQWSTYWIAGISRGECLIAAYQPLEDGGWRLIPVVLGQNREV